ncbi:hypothetical protein DFP73DRAFT_592874 [Morchella snyderi]|nr:hypothetical protein DFP73DRAFT_592874 [Morchella snyderi]
MLIPKLLLACFRDEAEPELGLEAINPAVDSSLESKQRIDVDIVAVHGLGGHRKKTWQHKKTKFCWLEELGKDSCLGGTARVFTFGYDASVVFTRSTARITTIADNLLEAMRRIREGDQLAVNRPIIFVCHSLGGIIVKKAMLNAVHNPTHGALFHSVFGIIFLGTPHQGSNSANLASTVINISKLSKRSKASGLLGALEVDSEILEAISNDFRHHSSGENRKFEKIVSIFETRITPGLREVVVPRNSAVLGLSGEIENQIGMETDHRGLCKFQSADSPLFRVLFDYIRALAEGAVQRQIDHISPENLELDRTLHRVNYEAHLEDVLQKRSRKTARWIFKNETFRSWKDSPGSRVLWLTGIVGSGKTVTAASVIEVLTKESDSMVARCVRPLVLYFFSDSKETAKADPLNLLSCLLRQILHHRVTYGNRIKQATSIATDSFLVTLGKTMDIMRELFTHIPKVYIILDALDECSGPKGELLTKIFQAAQSSGCVKVLVTTRIHPGPELDQAFQNPSFGKVIVKMSLAEKEVKEDIDRFLLQRIEATPGLKGMGIDLRLKVKNTIAEQASGVFLWASMAWEMFCGQAASGWTLETVDEGLAMLGDLCKRTEAETHSSRPRAPVDLYGFYTAILDRVPGNHREDTKRLFQFIVFAHTPLTLRQLGDACAIRNGDTDLKSIEGRVCFALTDEIKSRCYPFVQIVGADQTIKIVHSSIKEYFLSGGSGDYCFTNEHYRAHLDISLTCLTYLTFTDFATDYSTNANRTVVEEADLQTIEAHPFIKYSATHWSDHAKLAQDHSRIWESFLRWMETAGGSMETSFRIYWRTKGKGTFPRQTTPMHILCYLGMESLIELAFSTEESISRGGRGAKAANVKWASTICPDNVGRTPLHWAAANGHAGIVAILLEKSPNLQEKLRTAEDSKSSPLALAVDYGHMGIVEMLLNHSQGQTEHIQLLELASSGGHQELVKLIFNLGVDINIPVGDFGSALHAAAFGDHLEIVRWLVKQGAKVNLDHGKHGTPLQTAAFEGNLDIVKFLLKNDAIVNSAGGCHGSPLQAAAYRNWIEIATILIRHGAEVNATGGTHGSPLGAAIYSGHTDMIKLLKAKGARLTADTMLREPSLLDEATIAAIAQIGGEFQKGKMEVVEKRVEKVAKEFVIAIGSGNERTLRVLLQIGLRAFKVALKLQGADAFLLLIVRTALIILEDAVAKKFSRGIDIITRLYTDALSYALDEGRTSLVETLLFDCVNGFSAYLDTGEDAKARNIIFGGIELLFMVVRVGRRDLIEIIARKWVGVVEDLMGEQHEVKILGVVKVFAEKWVNAAIVRNKDIVLTYGRATTEALFAAVSTGKNQITNRLSNILTEAVQEILDSERNDVISWLVNLFKEQISELQLSQCDDKELKRICIFCIDILLATERVSRSGRNCQTAQKVCLGITVPILKDLEHCGLLDTFETTTRTVLQDKLSDCVDAIQVKNMQRDVSRILLAIMKTSRKISSGRDGENSVLSHGRKVIVIAETDGTGKVVHWRLLILFIKR